MTKSLYPEIENAGGLNLALDLAFQKAGSALSVFRDEDFNYFPGAYALVKKDNKYCQIYLAAEEKWYLPDFWRDGVCLALGQTDDIHMLVQCIDFWLTSDVTTAVLAETFSFINPQKNAVIFDNGNEVEYTWKSILSDPERKELSAFVELAIQNDILSKLFPYTSLFTLCFSRCTGYPYTYDTPMVIPNIETGQFIVRNSTGDEIGSGNAQEVLKMVLDHLPKDIGHAKKGTAED